LFVVVVVVCCLLFVLVCLLRLLATTLRTVNFHLILWLYLCYYYLLLFNAAFPTSLPFTITFSAPQKVVLLQKAVPLTVLSYLHFRIHPHCVRSLSSSLSG
jgi:hypothetical protein